MSNEIRNPTTDGGIEFIFKSEGKTDIGFNLFPIILGGDKYRLEFTARVNYGNEWIELSHAYTFETDIDVLADKRNVCGIILYFVDESIKFYNTHLDNTRKDILVSMNREELTSAILIRIREIP